MTAKLTTTGGKTPVHTLHSSTCTLFQRCRIGRIGSPNIKGSGESVKEWCAANNVKADRLWYRLRKHKADKDAPLFKSNQWLPVEVREHSPTGQQWLAEKINEEKEGTPAESKSIWSGI
ncbi:MAG: hypothetical protein KGZ93_03220 [Actinobacteria bacterium]|nr:hypothetical protein [Actinomycetota bacterium]